MSWNLSCVGKDGAEAKSKLAEANEQQGSNMPEVVQKLAEAAVDALPECKLDGYDAVALSTYGHFHDPEFGSGVSNLQLSVSHVENTGTKSAA